MSQPEVALIKKNTRENQGQLFDYAQQLTF